MLQRKSIELPIDSVCANPDQPRKFFAEEELMDLKKFYCRIWCFTADYCQKDKNGCYFLIAGERRLRAARVSRAVKDSSSD